MISSEGDVKPASLQFDVAIVSVGYERRCRWVAEKFMISANCKFGLEFGFLAEGSYDENRHYFENNGYSVVPGLKESVIDLIANSISVSPFSEVVKVFIDISSMSREMIANVLLAIQRARSNVAVSITVAYAPSKFLGPYSPAPIRLASPIKPMLAGWSSQPERPLGTIFGLGCEPGLALGALQVLEPSKAWVFKPIGVDKAFDAAMKAANIHIDDIFDVSTFSYEILRPTAARGRLESLLNAVDRSFRLIIVPFGPKIFAWLALATIIFTERTAVGVWAFSSKEHALPVDRVAEGDIVWHSLTLAKKSDRGAVEPTASSLS